MRLVFRYRLSGVMISSEHASVVMNAIVIYVRVTTGTSEYQFAFILPSEELLLDSAQRRAAERDTGSELRSARSWSAHRGPRSAPSATVDAWRNQGAPSPLGSGVSASLVRPQS